MSVDRQIVVVLIQHGDDASVEPLHLPESLSLAERTIQSISGDSKARATVVFIYLKNTNNKIWRFANVKYNCMHIVIE